MSTFKILRLLWSRSWGWVVQNLWRICVALVLVQLVLVVGWQFERLSALTERQEIIMSVIYRYHKDDPLPQSDSGCMPAEEPEILDETL